MESAHEETGEAHTVDHNNTSPKRTKISHEDAPQKESGDGQPQAPFSPDPDPKLATTILSSHQCATSVAQASPMPRKAQVSNDVIKIIPKPALDVTETTATTVVVQDIKESGDTVPTDQRNVSKDGLKSDQKALSNQALPKAKKGGRQKSAATIAKEEAKAKRAQERADKIAKEKAKKELVAREKRMWPAEYAATLPEKWKDFLAKQPESKLCFKGMNIFYMGDDARTIVESTQKKMDKVRSSNW